MAYTHLGFRIHEDILERFGPQFEELIKHLEMCPFQEEEWGVYQAFQSPPSKAPEFALRLERSRSILSNRIQDNRYHRLLL